MTKGEFEQLSFPTEEPKPVEVQLVSDAPTVQSDDQDDANTDETDGQMRLEEELERLHEEHLAEMEGSLERFHGLEVSWPAKSGKPERVSLMDAFVSYSNAEFGDNALIRDICEQRLMSSIEHNFPSTSDKVTLADGVEGLELPPLRDRLKQVNDSIEEEREAWDRLQFSGRDADISSTIGRLQERADALEKQIKEKESLLTFLDDLATRQSLREEDTAKYERIKERAKSLEKAYQDVALGKLQKATVEKGGKRVPLADLLADLYLKSELPNLPFEVEADNERKRGEVMVALRESFTPEELRRLVDALGRESDQAEQQYRESINIRTEPTEQELETMARTNEKRKKAYRKYKALAELIY